MSKVVCGRILSLEQTNRSLTQTSYNRNRRYNTDDFIIKVTAFTGKRFHSASMTTGLTTAQLILGHLFVYRSAAKRPSVPDFSADPFRGRQPFSILPRGNRLALESADTYHTTAQLIYFACDSVSQNP